MKKISALFLFLICLIISSCSAGSASRPPTPKSKSIDKVLSQSAKIMMDRYPIYGMGFGMGAMNEVENLSLSFEVREKMSKNELRLMLIGCVNEMITVVNHNEDIKPYLMQEGFGYKNVEVVFFLTNGKKEIFDPEITVAGYYSGYIGFKTKTPEQEYGYHQEDEETYEEAISILESQGHHEVLLEPALCKPGGIRK